ncbi:MAG: hypothetical protein ABIP93_15050 [Gemmatimonadaceae bacterium]
MSPASWNATIVDSPESEPYAVVGDLVVAVRTPRSRDFVTVEVAATSRCGRLLGRPAGVVVSSKPTPLLADEWHGELHLGSAVDVAVEGGSYRLTLTGLSVHSAGMPWVNCDVLVERT